MALLLTQIIINVGLDLFFFFLFLKKKKERFLDFSVKVDRLYLRICAIRI